MTVKNIYTSRDYLEMTNGSWHAEDSPWKADQVFRLIEKHDLHPLSIGEVGCGSGVVLQKLSERPTLTNTLFDGYDVSPDAIRMANRLRTSANVRFHQADPFEMTDFFNLLIVLDVLEHIPDYLGFLQKCQNKSDYKIYHIPLDIHVSSVLRNSFVRGRRTVGHLHYFVADSALDALRDTGHEIMDCTYTNGAIGLSREHRSLRRTGANVPRRILSRFSVPLTSRLLGGYSLLVLAK